MTYTKLPLSYKDLIQMLKKRGLTIADEDKALAWLHEVSYFRLANYLRPMEQDKVTHQFKASATFENAVALYCFDKELRLLIFEAIQNIEIALRAKIIHEFSTVHGSFWFMDAAKMTDEGMHAHNMSYVKREVNRSKEDFIVEHMAKYANPVLPPAWKTFEVISLGTMSKLFENMSDNTVKKAVAHELNLPQHIVLESWIRTLTVLRNCIAHHARIWNRRFAVKPQWHSKMRGAWVQQSSFLPEKLFAQLCCIQYLENEIQPGNTFKTDLKHLLARYPMVDVAAMGFPDRWEDEPLWKEQDKKKRKSLLDRLREFLFKS